MKNRYLKRLTTFTSDELAHKFDSLDTSFDKDSMVITEKILGGKELRLLRHQWNMHALYHSLQVYKLAYIYSGSFLIYTNGKPALLEEGSLCIVPPGVTKGYRGLQQQGSF